MVKMAIADHDHHQKRCSWHKAAYVFGMASSIRATIRKPLNVPQTGRLRMIVVALVELLIRNTQVAAELLEMGYRSVCR